MKIKIISPEGPPERPISAHGTKIFMDDKELHEVGDIKVEYPVGGGAVKVSFDMFATESLDIEANAEVNITLTALPGFELVNANNVYTCRRIGDK